MSHGQPPADPAAYIHQVARRLAGMGLHGDVNVDTPEQAADHGRQWGQVVFPSRHGMSGNAWLIWSDAADNREWDIEAGWEVWDFNGRVAALRPDGLRHPGPAQVAEAAYPRIARIVPPRT